MTVKELLVSRLRKKIGDRHDVPRYTVVSQGKKVVVTSSKVELYTLSGETWVLSSEALISSLPYLSDFEAKLDEWGVTYAVVAEDDTFETVELLAFTLESVQSTEEYAVFSRYLFSAAHLGELLDQVLGHFDGKGYDELTAKERYLLEKKSFAELCLECAMDVNKSPPMRAGDTEVNRDAQIRWYMETARACNEEFAAEAAAMGLGQPPIKSGRLTRYDIDLEVVPDGALALPEPVSLSLVAKSGLNVTLRWTKFDGLNFASYVLYTSTEPGIDKSVNGDIVTTVTDIEVRTHTVTVAGAGTYYFRVYVGDSHSKVDNDHWGISNELQVIVS